MRLAGENVSICVCLEYPYGFALISFILISLMGYDVICSWLTRGGGKFGLVFGESHNKQCHMSRDDGRFVVSRVSLSQRG